MIRKVIKNRTKTHTIKKIHTNHKIKRKGLRSMYSGVRHSITSSLESQKDNNQESQPTLISITDKVKFTPIKVKKTINGRTVICGGRSDKSIMDY